MLRNFVLYNRNHDIGLTVNLNRVRISRDTIASVRMLKSIYASIGMCSQYALIRIYEYLSLDIG